MGRLPVVSLVAVKDMVLGRSAVGSVVVVKGLVTSIEGMDFRQVDASGQRRYNCRVWIDDVDRTASAQVAVKHEVM